MAYRTLIAYVRSIAELKRIANAAALVAAKADRAHIIGIYAIPSPVVYADPNGFVDATLFEAHEARHKENATKLKNLFEAEMLERGLPHEFRIVRSNTGAASDGILQSAFRADLIVAGQPDPDDPDTSNDTTETLIFDSGRPVLLVPYAFSAPSDLSKVAVAFNGKREAARAAFDALPLLVAAKSVEIIWVDPPETNEQGSELAGSALAEALDRHGANVAITHLASQGLSAHDTIRQHIMTNGIDLLVMGAYSHSRLRELIFGGVTKAMLADMPTLTLLSR
ncbi:universal stress protein [Phyllobacterium salinisoli]|uniref:Universal stress protein n=1 Tax=Phyllobacterium salinisoli TaxID=1899321 RepID=A0A368K6S9_9HYPH|nr:universal stress protein [Phyllobacterium salinisoli]RCS24163.1 universal stress protein [Phyllobacterium salinisoli]